MTRAHALRIRDVFEEMHPQHVGLVQVITSSMERVRDGSYGDGLLTKFKKNNLPRIAISVDMLDTGVDVPEAQLIEFERLLNRELGHRVLELNSANIRKAYGLKVDNFLAFLRHILALDAIPDYSQLVRHSFEKHIAAHAYNADQIRFLRAVQEIFLRKKISRRSRSLRTAAHDFWPERRRTLLLASRDRRPAETHRPPRGLTRLFCLTRC